jgi:2-polyprenyl-3-methyl-5-hydroxy-6-metoxy-1,4-benzoquinol methylase
VTRRWGETAGWIMDVSCCMGRVCRVAATLGSRLRWVDCFDTEWTVTGALQLFGSRPL